MKTVILLGLCLTLCVAPPGKFHPVGLRKDSKEVGIIHGRKAKVNEFPYQVAIRRGNILVYCGGVILDETHIATAAHCVTALDGSVTRPEDIGTIFPGGANLKDNPNKGYRAVRVARHPQFQKLTKGGRLVGVIYDYAVIKVEGNLLTPIAGTQPKAVDLPTKDMEGTFIGKTAHVSGYGTTETGNESTDLLVADVDVQKDEICDQSYQAFKHPTNICAGYTGRHIGVGPGDSGGPLVVDQDTKHILIGLVSYGRTDLANTPQVYARAVGGLDFFHEEMKK